MSTFIRVKIVACSAEVGAISAFIGNGLRTLRGRLRKPCGHELLHFWTGPAIFQNKCVPKAVAKVVAIPGVIGTIQRFNSVFGIMWSAEVGNL